MAVILLCGPPCSGKTTLAHRLTTASAQILDFDEIARDLGSPTPWRHPEPYATQAEAEMQRRLADLPGDAIVIRCAPRGHKRQALAEQLGATAYVLNPGRAVCEQRARLRPSGTRRSIGLWYWAYRPWAGDHNPAELYARTTDHPEVQSWTPRLG